MVWEALKNPLDGIRGSVEILVGARADTHWRPVFQSFLSLRCDNKISNLLNSRKCIGDQSKKLVTHSKCDFCVFKAYDLADIHRPACKAASIFRALPGMITTQVG